MLLLGEAGTFLSSSWKSSCLLQNKDQVWILSNITGLQDDQVGNPAYKANIKE